MNRIITIDGPSGAGKGTLSLKLAKKLGFAILDSGAIYRLLAKDCILNNLSADLEDKIADNALNLAINFQISNDSVLYFLNDKDVTTAIRTDEVSAFASKIATYPKVRSALLTTQRNFANNANGLVADGRDMGTVVFPDAAVKIYLDAAPETRANRRLKQLQNSNINADYSEILENILKRDLQDKTRAVAPLIPALDAVIIDSSELTFDEVFAKALQIIQNAKSKLSDALTDECI